MGGGRPTANDGPPAGDSRDGGPTIAQKEERAMKSFACGDVVPGCDARWICSSEDEILARVSEHARSTHDLTDLTPDLVGAVRASITAA